MQDDPGVVEVLNKRRKELNRVFQQCARGQGGLRKAGVLQLTMAAFLDEVGKRGLIKDLDVRPTPSVVGTVLPSVHSNLSHLDVKGAFATAQNKGDDAAGGDASDMHVDFDEFCACLALCGHIKYAEVEQMDLPMRVAGIITNLLKEGAISRAKRG